MIARVADGLPLVGTMQEDEQVKIFFLVHWLPNDARLTYLNDLIGFQTGKSVLEYQNQAKLLFRKLTTQSPKRCSIETGPYLFQ